MDKSSKIYKKQADYFLLSLTVIQILIFFIPELISIQALVLLLSGVYFATKKKFYDNVIYIITFLAACDTYYRQVQISGYSLVLPWETSKYLSILLCAIFYFSSVNKTKKKYSILLTIFILFCIPSVIISIFYTDFSYDSIKASISGYFSGLFSLYVVCNAFDGHKMDLIKLKKITQYYFSGLIPTTFFLLKNLYNISDIEFGLSSNFAFSGYGPIHISTSISFLLCLLLITNHLYKLWNYKIIITFVSMIYLLLMILTFSRAGLFMLIISMSLVLIFQKNKLKFLFPIVVFSLIFYLFIYPIISDVTYGAVEDRFGEVTPSSRVDLIKSDFNIFLDYPFFGVGLGRAYLYRDSFDQVISLSKSHTEFTRFLSEQGLFGFLCNIIYFLIFMHRIKSEKFSHILPLVIFFVGFPTLYFAVNAFSTFLPAYCLGISMIQFKVGVNE